FAARRARARRRVFPSSFVSLIVSSRLGRGARHPGIWSPRCKKIRPAGIVTATAPTSPRVVRHCQELATHRAVMALNGNIRNFACGPLQDGKQRLVAPVHILTEFYIASVIYESGLISQVDRDEARKWNVDFVVTKHSTDAVLAIAFAWADHRQQHFRIFYGILHPHAAVAFSAPLICEQVFLI